jgi:hypothetical protein
MLLHGLNIKDGKATYVACFVKTSKLQGVLWCSKICEGKSLDVKQHGDHESFTCQQYATSTRCHSGILLLDNVFLLGSSCVQHQPLESHCGLHKEQHHNRNKDPEAMMKI